MFFLFAIYLFSNALVWFKLVLLIKRLQLAVEMLAWSNIFITLYADLQTVMFGGRYDFFLMDEANNTELMRRMLLERMEKRVGRSIRTPRDFDFLAMRIYEATNMLVSISTLKRLWGYVRSDNKTLRISTLNILACFVGYIDWDAFCRQSGVVESDFVLNDHISTNMMCEGCIIKLMWHPDRVLKVRYEGHDLFTVMESVNSKLSEGDTFHIGQIVDGEPLYLRGLVHEGGEPVGYVCGKVGGVKYQILN